MNEKMQLILGKARNVFVRCGFRNVTMDDVCREMGISKKTLYQHVSDKADLVAKTVKNEIERDKAAVDEITRKYLNPIDELYEITKYVANAFKQLHPATIYEMQKYYPEAWDLIQNYKDGYLVKIVMNNIRRGQEMGIYYKDVIPEIVSRLYAEKLDLLTDIGRRPDPEFAAPAFFFETLKYHIRGISNANGILYLNEKLAQIQA